jgi:hypothetical protein
MHNKQGVRVHRLLGRARRHGGGSGWQAFKEDNSGLKQHRMHKNATTKMVYLPVEKQIAKSDFYFIKVLRTFLVADR